jgi:pimeloyl-ACP methyl ester carboxylesterase
MKFASEYPHRVEKLIVVDIAPKAYPLHHQDIINGLRAIPIEKINNRQEADSLLASYVSSQKTRLFLLKNLYRKDDQSYAWRLNLDALCEHATNIGSSITEKLWFEKQAIFIRGGASDYILPEDEPNIIKMFPKATIIGIPGATHWVHAEKPDEFIAIIQSFLNK